MINMYTTYPGGTNGGASWFLVLGARNERLMTTASCTKANCMARTPSERNSSFSFEAPRRPTTTSHLRPPFFGMFLSFARTA